MSRIFRDNGSAWDLEQISAIRHKEFTNDTFIHIGGQCVLVGDYEGIQIQNAWEEYMKDKESRESPVASLNSHTASWDLR